MNQSITFSKILCHMKVKTKEKFSTVALFNYIPENDKLPV